MAGARVDRFGPTGRDVLRAALALLVGWGLGAALWESVRLPYSNPDAIVGPLTALRFNPATNLLRYALFVGLPAVLYGAWVVVRGGWQPRGTAGAEPRPPAVSARRALAWVAAGALVGTALEVLRFLSGGFTPALDQFHHGEWLAPAWNYVSGRGLWRGTYFLHGVFYDPLATVLGWAVTGQQTIGACLLTQDVLHLLLPAAVAGCLTALALCCPPGRRGTAAWALTVLGALVLTVLLTDARLQVLNRRDVPVLIGVAAFLFGLYFDSRAGLVVAGLASSATYFYVIDRGAYYNAALLVTMVAVWARAPHPAPPPAAARVSLAWCALGIAIGWAAFGLAVGGDEFRAFVDATATIYRTKDLFDSYVFPTPAGFSPLVNSVAVLCIGVQALLAVRLLLRGAPREALAAQLLVAALAGFYFRSALGRSDRGHVLYACFFAYVGLTYSVGALFGTAVAARPRACRTASALLAGAIAVVLWLRYAPIIDRDAIGRAPLRIATLLGAPDEAFLSPTERLARERLLALTRDDACFFTYTSEGVWPYLLRKPTCGRHAVVWFAAPRPLQEEVLRDLDTYRPSHILLRSPGVANAIDGIANAQRFPLLDAAIQSRYEPVEHIGGYVIGRRLDGAHD